MSFRSGDRARANKQKTKRRLRRSLLRVLRKHTDPVVAVIALVPAVVAV
jgi:hypothetical protein